MQNETTKIINLLKNKRFERAITLCKNLLNQTNHPQLHLFLAIAYGQNNNINESIEIFEQLINHFPQNPEISYNYALVLQNNNMLDIAIKQYNICLTLQPQNFSAWNNLGEIHRTNQAYEFAIHAFSQCLQIQPNNIQYIRNLGITYYQNNAFSKAQPLLINTIYSKQFDVDDGIAILDILITLRQLRLATEIGTTVLNKYKDNPEILNLIGLNELEKRKFKPSIQYLEKAIALKPAFLSAMCHLASAFMFAGEISKSASLLKEISNFKDEQAYVFVSMMHEISNQQELARAATNQGLRAYPNNTELLLIHAKLFRKEKKYSQALAFLEKAAKHTKKKTLLANTYYEKGQIFDKSGEYSKSWEQFKFANKLSLESWEAINPNPDSFIVSCKKISRSFKSLKQMKPNKETYGCGDNLIFIVGFPRSGTTLLDSILSAHTEVSVLEEAPIIGEAYDQITNISLDNYAQTLSKLSYNEKQNLRSFYYDSLKNYTQWNHQGVLVDKSPLNTVHVGLIHKLFPDAKIVFSQRHPLDVCISCFFQDFKMNGFMTNLTCIKKTAKTYSAMLSVWEKSIKKFNIDFRYQSYENLVGDFESETKQLLHFLGLKWQDKVLNYQLELKNRGVISTPSYNQVNQPIYQTAKNRYKNYLTHLDKPIKILNPWIDYFGYAV